MYKEFKNNDGSIDMITISSDDNYEVKLDKTYKLVNPISKKNNGFKNSMFGSDIGIRSRGFSTVILLSMLVAIGSLLIMYFNFRI